MLPKVAKYEVENGQMHFENKLTTIKNTASPKLAKNINVILSYFRTSFCMLFYIEQ